MRYFEIVLILDHVIIITKKCPWHISFKLALETLRKHNEKDDGDKSPYVVTSYVVVRGLTRNNLTNYKMFQN